MAGLVLVDATPPQAGSDRAAAAGFALSGALARTLQAGTRVGVTQLLLRLGLMPGYFGQHQLQAGLSRTE